MIKSITWNGTALVKIEPTENDIATGDPQMRPNDITAQEIAHEEGKPCDEEDCQDCCGEFAGHEHDSSEGGYCLNCGHHPNA
jgi:hypothetical protein